MKKNKLFKLVIPILFLALPLTLISCSKDKKKEDTSSQVAESSNSTNTENQYSSTSNQTTTSNETSNSSLNTSTSKTSKSNSSETNDNNKSYLGNWIIKKKLATAPVYALSDDEIQSYIGKNLSITEKSLSFNGENYINPTFKDSILSNEDFISQYNISLKNLGINSSSVKKVDISQKNTQQLTSFGSAVFIKDDGTLVTSWDGVFFELKKE